MIDEKSSSPFEFADRSKLGRADKTERAARGYFADAWSRFRKNGASTVAICIILAIVLFALIAPLFNTANTGTVATSRYMKLGPRNLFLSRFGIATGDKRDTYSEQSLINTVAIGICAEENGESVGEALTDKSSLQPLTRIISEKVTVQGKEERTVFRASADEYLKVGFVYMYFEEDELLELERLEEELGIRIFYPIPEENENNFAYTAGLTENANWWYKTDARGYPTDADGVPLSYESIDSVKLIDNYMRDADGEPVYRVPSGASMYKTRVLFYNYYRATHGGAEPEFLLGTDSAGYDLAYRIAVGIRLSLALSLSVFAINFIIGAAWGAVGGYFGGRCDLILQFISYVLAGVPFMVVATLFQIHLASRAGAIPSLLFAFVLTGWIGTASRVRTQFYRFKGREYIMAVRTLGASDGRIILKHIFPNALGTIITASVLSIPGVIFSESMLSYLGIINLGTDKMTSLGTLLSDAGSSWMSSPHLMIFPALVISLLMICFNLFGNGLRDALDPSLRGAVE